MTTEELHTRAKADGYQAALSVATGMLTEDGTVVDDRPVVCVDLTTTDHRSKGVCPINGEDAAAIGRAIDTAYKAATSAHRSR